MSKKSLIILVTITFILSILSLYCFFFDKDRISKENNITRDYIFDGIKANKVNKILIEQFNNQVALRQNNNEKWVVDSLFDYPADISKIKKIINDLITMKAIHKVYVNKESSEKYLKLLSPEGNNSPKGTGNLIKLYDKNNKELAFLLVGKRRYAKKARTNKKLFLGRYIKKLPLEDIFFTTSLLYETDYNSIDWLNKEFVQISDIKKIKLSKNNQKIWNLIKSSDKQQFILSEMKKNISHINDSMISRIISSINNLDFYSVASPDLSKEKTGLDDPYVLKVFSKNNEVYKICIGNKKGDKYYLKLKDYPKKSKEDIDIRYENWIYLVNEELITPLLSDKEKLLKKESSSRSRESFQTPLN